MAETMDSGTTTRATGRLRKKAASVASTTPTRAPGSSFIDAGRSFSHPSMPPIVSRPTAKAVAASWLERPKICRSEEHTSELQSLMRISYAVFCLTKKQQIVTPHSEHANTKHNLECVLRRYNTKTSRHISHYREIS